MDTATPSANFRHASSRTSLRRSPCLQRGAETSCNTESERTSHGVSPCTAMPWVAPSPSLGERTVASKLVSRCETACFSWGHCRMQEAFELREGCLWPFMALNGRFMKRPCLAADMLPAANMGVNGAPRRPAASESPRQGSVGSRLGAHWTADRGGTASRRLFSKPVFSRLADTSTRSVGYPEESGKGESPRSGSEGGFNWSP